MTLDSGHALCLCEGHELVLESFLSFSHHETYVHHRTVFDRCCSAEHAVSVDLAVEEFCLGLVDLLDGLDATLLLEPAESLVHHVDREYRRCVEHRTAVDMCAEVEHCRNIAAYLSEEVLLHDEESDTCRSYVLLGATIDHRILAHVDRTAHDV